MPGPGEDLVAPPAPTNLVATAGNAQVDLTWSGSAALFKIYRSPVSGGGYAYIGETTGNAYTDTSVVNGRFYYYVVRAEDASGNLGEASNEASAIPAFAIGWAGLVFPPSINHTLGVPPTPNIYGQVYVPGLTDNITGDPAAILAQVGFGPVASDPAAWTTWKPMAYNTKVGSNFEYMENLRPEQTGSFDYLVRFSTNLGSTWTYGYVSGTTRGALTVNPNIDTTPPVAPVNLRVTDWSSGFIDLAWQAVGDAAEYWLYRSATSGSYGEPLIKVTAPITSYNDLSVDPGNTYYYVVKAVDAALNLSGNSNEVSKKAEPKIVNVTFRVRVPDFTPPTDTIYIAGGTLPLEWNPGNKPMTNMGGGIWEITLQFMDGINLQYKYTRGSWEKVESWGSIFALDNRSVAISYGVDGNQLVDNTATDWGVGEDSTKAVQYWRDPLVASTTPANGYNGVAPANIVINFDSEIQPLASPNDYSTAIVVTLNSNPVAGTITPSSGFTPSLTWTPTVPLGPGTYTVTVFNVRSNRAGESMTMQVQYIFTFTVTVCATDICR